MEVILAVTIGLLYAAGVYLMLRRSIIKLILGMIFLGNATNLFIFAAGGLTEAAPSFLTADNKPIAGAMADPLPQALILTAIVIGLGFIAFAIVLKYKFWQVTGTDDLDQLKETD
jgi:multicomponent Na+:H+ antiporter subunit C